MTILIAISQAHYVISHGIYSWLYNAKDRVGSFNYSKLQGGLNWRQRLKNTSYSCCNPTLINRKKSALSDD